MRSRYRFRNCFAIASSPLSRTNGGRSCPTSSREQSRWMGGRRRAPPCATCGTNASAPVEPTRRCGPTGRRTSSRPSPRSGRATSASTGSSTTTCSSTAPPTAVASVPRPRSPSRCTRSPTSTRCSTRSSTPVHARSSSSGSCRVSWPLRPRPCSGGERTAARPPTWAPGPPWYARR